MKNLKLAFVALAASAFMYACGSSESTAEQNQDSTTMMEEEEPMAEEETQPIIADTETQSTATAGAASASITTPPTGAATVAKTEEQQPAAATQAATKQAPAAKKQAAAKPAEVDPALIAQGKTLVENSDCRACHAVDSKLVGPSFKEVAERYQKDPKAVDMLAGKIIEGGAGNWGQIPMAPHPQISKGDASKMVQYVLSLNK